MREILFRGKRLDNGEWIEGYFVKFEWREIPEIYTGWNCYTLTPECYGIEPSTVGQYTGLTDRNGKKIFEGDIVKYYHHKKSLVPVTDIKPEENHYCNEHFVLEEGTPTDNCYFYCPNCGAKMDGQALREREENA